MDYNVIKQTAKDRKVSIKNLAQLCDMTPVGLHQAMSNKTLKIETLEKIADVLDVPVASFFERKLFTAKPAAANERLTPQPVAQEQTASIMALNITDKEKIKMLREHISVVELQLMLTRQLLKATQDELEKMKQ